MSAIFEPIQVGDLYLKNRIVLAPLTRSRADYERVPNDLMMEYYAQRAGMGMIVTESTPVDPMGVGYPRKPGIWNEAQVQGWLKSTDAVHASDGLIVLQLWHVGRLSDPLYLNGATPIAPSAIGPDTDHIALIRSKRYYGVPREMTQQDITDAVTVFRVGAENANKAGFDGMEIHGGNGYLLDQFLQSNSNLRSDAYGGTLPNRAHFPLEVVDAVIDVWGAGRVGYHIASRCDVLGMVDRTQLKTFGYLMEELSRRNLAFVLSRGAAAPDSINPKLRKIFRGKLS